jgi:signal transduction histidine kinase
VIRSRLAASASLRWRLLAATGLLAALLVAIAGTLLLGLFRSEVQRQFASSLRSQLDEVTARLEWTADGEPLLPPASLSDPRWRRPYGGLYWQVEPVQANHRPPLRSRSLWDTQLAVPADAVTDGEVHVHALDGPAGQSLLLVERSVRPGSDAATAWRVLVAGDLRESEAAVQRLRGALIGGSVLLLVLMLAAAWVQTGIGLAPLRRLQAALAALRGGQATRLAGRFPSELQPLADDFNGVLDRQADSLARARTQAGNLAHALKTPLAVLAQAAEQPGLVATPAAALLVEQVQRIRRQVDWHLARARAAALQGQPGERTPLRPSAEALLRVLGRLHTERGLQLQLVLPDGLPGFAGDAQDLQEMLGNLLDNACRWARHTVRLSASTAPDGRLWIDVDDDGPGIPAAQRAQALARGQRLDESLPGSGLGLAIVAELAQLYGGALSLDDAPLGGLRARLLLPS